MFRRGTLRLQVT